MTTLREHTELPQALESLLEAHTADAIFVVGPDLRVVYWDAQAESLTGLLSEEMMGKRCYEAVLGEGEGGVPFCSQGCSVMHLCQAKRAVSNYDMRISCRWGSKRWVNVSILSVDSEEGPYLVHLMRDSQKSHEALEIARGLIRLSSTEKGASTADRGDILELTTRQSEVLKLLSEGKSVKDICRELYISQATVRNHIRSLLQVLGAHSQLEALARARELGLLSR